MDKTPKTRLDELFPGNCMQHLLLIHEMLRDYTKHEDDLINQRSTWHLLIQGFLFATFGAMGAWQSNNFLEKDRFSLLAILSYTGLFISVAVGFSILAALISTFRLARKWKELNQNHEIPEQVWKAVPSIGGAGSGIAVWFGLIPSLLIPIIISVAWANILHYAETRRPTGANDPIMQIVKPLESSTPVKTSEAPCPCESNPRPKHDRHVVHGSPKVPVNVPRPNATATPPS